MPTRTKLSLRELFILVQMLLGNILVQQTVICAYGTLALENVFKQCVVIKTRKILLEWQQMEITLFVVSLKKTNIK